MNRRVNFLKAIKQKYPPLDKKEEQILIEDYQQTNNPEALGILINHNCLFVATVINRLYYDLQPEKKEELFQEGIFGVINAIKTFDKSRGASLIYLIGLNVRSYLRDYYQQKHLVKLPNSAAKVAGEEFVNNCKNTTSIDEAEYDIEDVAEQTIDSDKKYVIDWLMSNLSKVEVIIITNRFGIDEKKPLNHVELAKELNMTPNGVRLKYYKALEKIKEKALGNEIIIKKMLNEK
jgi:RNA polymerase sigma factor (sigma-70 family)